MVDKCVRFLFTSCENEKTRKRSYKRDNHEVICLLYEYKDECRVTEYFSDTDRRL